MRYRRRIVLHYPLASGRLVVRTEQDWARDIEADEVNGDGTRFAFWLECDRPWLYFKPCIVVGHTHVWARGANRLALLVESDDQHHYPYFYSDTGGTCSPVLNIESAILARAHRVRVYTPPGYEENYRKRYPVLYMQDGKNLFFPDEAFMGRDWRVDETVATLDAMSLIDKVIVVGLHSDDRENEYTQPGYEDYARSVVEELKPAIDAGYRTLPGAAHTGVMGSSLGGVVSLYMAWQWPDVFQMAACMSSTFGWRDDLLERVLSEQKRDIHVYLDSGWPEDNYEATLTMAMAMLSRGWTLGSDLVHLVFPRAKHEEPSWAQRLPLPLQSFGGKVRRAALLSRLERNTTQSTG
jgi:predicted alpha/beta superfamily hydrolase